MNQRTDFWQVLVLAVVLLAFAAWVALLQPQHHHVHAGSTSPAVHFPTEENP